MSLKSSSTDARSRSMGPSWCSVWLVSGSSSAGTGSTIAFPSTSMTSAASKPMSVRAVFSSVSGLTAKISLGVYLPSMRERTKPSSGSRWIRWNRLRGSAGKPSVRPSSLRASSCSEISGVLRTASIRTSATERGTSRHASTLDKGERHAAGRLDELRTCDVEKLEPHEGLDIGLFDDVQLGEDLAQLPAALDETRSVFELMPRNSPMSGHHFAEPVFLLARGGAHDEA